jgi:phospholipase C
MTVTPNAYTRQPPRTLTVAPRSSVMHVWPLAESRGWYDLSVTTDASPKFLRRLAGRVETGRPSVSDPAFGAGKGRNPGDN